MKISDVIVSFIESKGVEYVFGYIGGAITHIVDSIDKNNKVKFIQTYHEQTAAISAEGYARETNNVGVAIATSGPGATNLITGIADAYFDSIPVIYITGQVNTYEFKYDKPIRQQGFQEMDVISVVTPLTKYSKLVDKAEDIIYELEKAYSIATSGRPGPVLLDIPMDVQRAEIDIKLQKKYVVQIKSEIKKYLDSDIKKLIINSNRPILLVGGGAKCLEEKLLIKFQQFIKENNIPVVCSLMGKGILKEDQANFLGMIGSYGNRCANMSIANSDLLIALGSRLDTRQTGACFEKFLHNGEIIQIDLDVDELKWHRIEDKIDLNWDVNDFVREFIKLQMNVNEDWILHTNKLKEKYNQYNEIERFIENKSPYILMNKINEISKQNDIFVADIGQNQMWSAQTLKVHEKQNFYTSGGLAPMGFSIPFSIGLSFGNKNKRILSISGDGGFHMSTQGLMLVSQYSLPIKVIVINNNALGMITQFQGLYFDNNMAGTTATSGYVVPSIKHIAEAYSLEYYRLTENNLTNDDLICSIFNSNNPCIIEYVIDGLTAVSPKLEYNSPIYNTSPKLDSTELEEALQMKIDFLQHGRGN